jgi:hypothetical protein
MGDDKKKKSGLGKKLFWLVVLLALVVGGSKGAAIALGNPELDLLSRLLKLAGL